MSLPGLREMIRGNQSDIMLGLQFAIKLCCSVYLFSLGWRRL